MHLISQYAPGDRRQCNQCTLVTFATHDQPALRSLLYFDIANPRACVAPLTRRTRRCDRAGRVMSRRCDCSPARRPGWSAWYSRSSQSRCSGHRRGGNGPHRGHRPGWPTHQCSTAPVPPKAPPPATITMPAMHANSAPTKSSKGATVEAQLTVGGSLSAAPSDCDRAMPACQAHSDGRRVSLLTGSLDVPIADAAERREMLVMLRST